MTILGEMFIGSQAVKGTDGPIQAVNPATNEALEPVWQGATANDVDNAAKLAWDAYVSFRETSPEARAGFLEACADEILALGDELVERAVAETGLPRARIEGERGRTMNQLRLFASVVRAGHYLEARIDPAMPDRQPMPRVDLRMRMVPLGPVAVFGASNFPLAFSVAGGDTAAALAAGCPVVVKAHSAHPGTSELVGRAIQKAVADCQLHEGVFSLIYGAGIVAGQSLVAHPRIKAVGFTGSRSGGTALMEIAANRPVPIPVYAEMSSINPVFLMPNALRNRGEEIGKALVGSLLMGAGQFCTNPGLIFALEGDDFEGFLNAAKEEISKAGPQTMLTPGIHQAYCSGVEQFADNPQVTKVATGQDSGQPNQCQARLFLTSAEAFLDDERLSAEIFGSSSLVVKCKDIAEFRKVANNLEGQLTITLQLDESDHEAARELLPILEDRAGRILCNGYPTGVEVGHAMVHGGPYPATSDGRTTSVGSLAIQRFIRPVCYQDLPESLLPEALKDTNPLGIRRLVDGEDQR